jgi:TonB family protein
MSHTSRHTRCPELPSPQLLDDPGRAPVLPADLAEHLANCEHCAAELTRLQLLERRLERLDADFALPDGFVERLTAQLPSEGIQRVTPTKPPRHRRWLAPVALAASVAALAGVLWSSQRELSTPPTPSPAPGAAVGQVTALSPGASLRVRRPGGDWQTASSATSLRAPLELAAGDRGRVTLTLDDGSSLLLDRHTQLIVEGRDRLRLRRGRLLASVRPRSASSRRLRIALDGGSVSVLGTKLQLQSGREGSSVEVLHGVVALRDARGRRALVSAAQQGWLVPPAPPLVGPAPDLGRALAWTRDAEGELDATPHAPGIGSLTARRPGRRGRYALRLAEHRVKARVAGAVARTEIRETFANDTRHTLEGVFRFPLPAGARISRLALYVDGRLEEGTFVERGRAKRIWRGVLRQGTPKRLRKRRQDYVWVPGPWRDPALLEWKQGNSFELRVFPIRPRSSRTVILAYTETLPRSARGHRYVYPLPHGETARAERFAFELRVDAGERAAPIARGYRLKRRRADDGSLRLTFATERFAPRGDLAVDLARQQRARGLESLVYRDPRRPDQAAWALLTLRPKLEAARREARARDLVLIVDRSLSILGETARRQLLLLRALLGELPANDRVTLLACDSSCVELGRRWAARGEHQRLLAALAARKPGGASDIGGALRRALDALRDRPLGRERHVVLIGDGVPTTGERRAERLARTLRKRLEDLEARVSTVGVGSDVDARVLRKLARAGGGDYCAYQPGLSARGQALKLLAALSGPALERPVLSLPAGLTEVGRRQLPTLRAGAELLITARLAGPTAGVAVLRGTLGGKPFRQLFPLDLRPLRAPAAGSRATQAAAFVPRLWAQQTLERLADQAERATGAETARLRKRIVGLSRRYRLLSRYTSLLVLESEAMRRAFGVRALPRRLQAEAFGGDQGTKPDVSGGTPGHGLIGSSGVGKGGGGRGLGRLGTGRRREVLGLIGRIKTAGGGKQSSSRAPRYRPGSRVPPPRLGRASVRGSLDKTIIRRVIRRQLPRIRAVFERSLKRNPALGGRLSLRFTIGASGRVIGAQVAGGSDPALRAALRRVTLRWRFPAPKGGGSVVVTYPLVFRSAGGGAAPKAKAPFVPLTRPPALGTRVPPRPLNSRRRRSWRLMRRVRVQQASWRSLPGAGGHERVRLARLERRLAAKPLSRDRTRALYRAQSRAGRASEALRTLERWLAKEPRSAEALRLLVEGAARAGRHERALRALGSLVELGAEEPTRLRRAARAHRLAGEQAVSCAFTLSLSLLRPRDGGVRRQLERCQQQLPVVAEAHGRVQLRASWRGDADLDLALVDQRGRIWSWLSGRWGVRARHARHHGRERLALRWLPAGRYRVEVRRAQKHGPGLIAGRLALRAPGLRRSLPFRLRGRRAYLGELRIEQQTRLVPAR